MSKTQKSNVNIVRKERKNGNEVETMICPSSIKSSTPFKKPILEKNEFMLKIIKHLF